MGERTTWNDATTPAAVRPRTVGILIFPEVEILDFCGPFEVFASATLPSDVPGEPETRLFDVVTIAERAEIVACRGGLLVQPNQTFAEHFPLDILVVPGGYRHARASRRTRSCSTGSRASTRPSR